MGNWWIGIDGTDSATGGCTTWTASNLIDDLIEEDPNIVFIGYPRLIRLNPNVPFKTRGNGAVVLHIVSSLDLESLSNMIRDRIIEDQSLYENDPNKTAAFVISRQQPPQSLYYDSLQYLLTPQEILKVFTPDYYWPKESQSLVGSICAISAKLNRDFTYELLSYRYWENCGSERIIQNIRSMSSQFPTLFSNFDVEQDRELIAPSGPDPVFYGIRGDDPNDLIRSIDHLSTIETPRSYTIFVTNQATDDHSYKASRSVKEYEVFSSIVQLLETPEILEGGHVSSYGHIKGVIYQIMWFEPTKQLRDNARQLLKGDWIAITASVHHTMTKYPTLHVEYMYTVDIPNEIKKEPPICSCENRMTSAGSFAGYKCKSCGNTTKFADITNITRNLPVGNHIFASISAQRHLTRPKSRWLRRSNLTSEKLDYNAFRKVFD